MNLVGEVERKGWESIVFRIYFVVEILVDKFVFFLFETIGVFLSLRYFI